jgi:hypothetical protein
MWRLQSQSQHQVNDGMTLGATARLYPLTVLGCPPVDVAGDRREPDERHRCGVGMFEDSLDGVLIRRPRSILRASVAWRSRRSWPWGSAGNTSCEANGAKVTAVKVGDGRNPEGDMGPVSPHKPRSASLE